MPYGFYGGVHPPAFKTLTSDKTIKKVFIPQRVVVPLSQHVGAPAEPVVAVGDSVEVGALIGKAAGFISSPVHATISGKVTGISYSPTPTSARILSVSIQSGDGHDQEFKAKEAKAASNLSKEEILNIIKNSGLVGLGGAAFPTHVKLSPPKGRPIDSVILNGAECEPYLTCDYRLMIEKPNEILKGLEITAKVLGVKDIYIAIEDNKPLAIDAMEKAVRAMNYEQKRPKIVVLRTRYPQGAEKQVIKSVLNRIVPAGGLPMDVGCVVHNVGTVFAIYEAVYFRKPLIERAVTITGHCIKEPVNLCVRIGTILSDLVDVFGGFVEEPEKIIIGGPMMGVAQYTMDVPLTKGTSGVIFLSKGQIDKSSENVCIRCGKCIEVCPMGLVPTTIMYNTKKERFAEAKGMGIMNCFECGACAYECPAKIPLLDYMKFGKSKIQNGK